MSIVGFTENAANTDAAANAAAPIGHWVAEQAPEQELAVLTAFLAPHRD